MDHQGGRAPPQPGVSVYEDKINLEKALLHVPYLLQALAEKLGPLLRGILGDQVFLEYEQVMAVRAGSSYATRRHRDVDGGKEGFSEASKRHKASVHLWIPLVDIDEACSRMYVEPFDAPEPPVELLMRAGDALFLHNYVWHGSRANTSTRHRLSWLLNFAPAPSRDETNPKADLNLQLLRDGVPHRPGTRGVRPPGPGEASVSQSLRRLLHLRPLPCAHGPPGEPRAGSPVGMGVTLETARPRRRTKVPCPLAARACRRTT